MNRHVLDKRGTNKQSEDGDSMCIRNVRYLPTSQLGVTARKTNIRSEELEFHNQNIST
jgi:hypothetical protein